MINKRYWNYDFCWQKFHHTIQTTLGKAFEVYSSCLLLKRHKMNTTRTKICVMNPLQATQFLSVVLHPFIRVNNFHRGENRMKQQNALLSLSLGGLYVHCTFKMCITCELIHAWIHVSLLTTCALCSTQIKAVNRTS